MELKKIAEGLKPAAEAVKPLTEGTAKFLALLLKPGTREFGEWIGDRIHIMRVQNLEKLAVKTKAQLDAYGTKPKPVPTKILVEVVEKCSIEDDEEMIDRWASLLASSASGVNVPPSYVQTLASLSPTEARFFDYVARRQGHIESTLEAGIIVSSLQRESNLTETEFNRVTLSLVRQQLLRRISLPISRGILNNNPIKETEYLGTSPFGNDFLDVCSPHAPDP
jgi:hypothetical protein